MASKKSFVLYMDYKERFSKLNNAQFGELMRMVFDYEMGIEPVTDDVMVDISFDVIRYDLDKNRAKYEEIIEKRREAGKSKGKQTEANDSKCKQMIANANTSKQETPVSDSDSVSVSVNDSDSDSVTQSMCVKKEKNKKEKRKRFTPPTLEEVMDYAFEKGITINAEDFIDYYSSQGWKLSNGNQMKDWQAAARRWAKRSEMDRPRSGTREMSKEEYLAYWGLDRLDGGDIFDAG